MSAPASYYRPLLARRRWQCGTYQPDDPVSCGGHKAEDGKDGDEDENDEHVCRERCVASRSAKHGWEQRRGLARTDALLGRAACVRNSAVTAVQDGRSKDTLQIYKHVSRVFHLCADVERGSLAFDSAQSRMTFVRVEA